MVLKKLIFNSFQFGRVCGKECIFNGFFFSGLERTDKFLSFGGCGGSE